MNEISSLQIKAKAREVGFHEVGIATVEPPPQQATAHLQRWLNKGYQAEMAWMANPKRADIEKCLPGVKSVISVALNYYTPHRHSEDSAIAKISRYGWGRDYHRVLHKKLKALTLWLQTEAPDHSAKYYADTGPVQDKVWAQRAGLGWIAKNSNVITRDYGSWVFLGEVLTTLALERDRPHTNHCGTCTRCIEACPTQAIREPYVVDANRCIAYHTIENRAETLPPNLNLDNWVAGCDVCQDVCPWNQRFAQETDVADFQPYPGNLHPQLTKLAELDEATWDERFRGSALRRIKPAMWRRNAQANLRYLKEESSDGGE